MRGSIDQGNNHGRPQHGGVLDVRKDIRSEEGNLSARTAEKSCAPKSACCAARSQPRGGCSAKRVFWLKCCASAIAQQLGNALVRALRFYREKDFSTFLPRRLASDCTYLPTLGALDSRQPAGVI